MAIIDNSQDALDNLLLSAVQLGDFTSLKTHLLSVSNPTTYLNRVHEESQERKYTLLMLACLNEDKDMVRMLLESFHPDTEVLNHIKISVKDQNPKIYENVTALWAVTAINNFEMVKLLVEYGARVNHTTKTNSTPLRCACFHGNITMARYLIENGADIRIAKEHNDTNLILSVFRQHVELVAYLVDELGCDINECDDEGRSSLYIAVERGSFELVQFLLNHGARNFLSMHDQMSPLMLAAEKRRNDLVDIIFPYCSLIEGIEAEELLGSAFACMEYGVCDLEKTFEHFSRALELRSMHQLTKSLRESSHGVFNHRQECQTIDQLKELRANSDDMYIEALLIRERLLGPSNFKYRNSLLYRGATLAHTTQYHQGIAIWMYELELHRQWSIPISSKQLRYFVKTFAIIVHKWSSISIQNLCIVMKVVMDALDRNTDEFEDNLYTLLFLITIISQSLTKTLAIDTDRRMFYQLIRSINQYRYVTPKDGSSLLHLSLTDRTLSTNPYIDRICKYPCLHTVRTLVQCGTNVNASNALRNTPIHVFVSNSSDCDETILQVLCDADVHLDYANALRETPMDLALNLNIKRLLKTRIRLSLKCLCARLIQKNDIPFHGKIVNSLVTFVARH